MKNGLPSVYSNPIDKEIKNNKEYYYSTDNDVRNAHTPKDISREINEIFARKDFVYKQPIRVTTFQEIKDVILVGRTNTDLLTLENERIPIISITNIELL